MRTILDLDEVLPLTCTRSGTCCHGKDIRLTPWELARLAQARRHSARNFRDSFTVDAGTRLRLDGPLGWRGLSACSQYTVEGGCSVHAARPLACRLYPLGRERQGGTVRIIHEGRRFPCLDGCPEVEQLAKLTVREYLAGQGSEPFALVRDAYLDIAQDLAEGAFTLVFDGGLRDGQDQRWRQAWQVAVDDGPLRWPTLLGAEWYDMLTVPQLEVALDDGVDWSHAHAEALQLLANSESSAAHASVRLFCGALLLFRAVGGEVAELGRRWLAQADG